MVALFGSKHALLLCLGLFVRHRVVVGFFGCCCIALFVDDSFSLHAGGVESLLGQACVFGQTHASIDARPLTHLHETCSSGCKGLFGQPRRSKEVMQDDEEDYYLRSPIVRSVLGEELRRC